MAHFAESPEILGQQQHNSSASDVQGSPADVDGPAVDGSNNDKFTESISITSVKEEDQKVDPISIEENIRMAHFAESPVILGQQQQNSSASRVEEFRRAFNLFDKDDSGSIDEYELVGVMRAVGEERNPEEIKELMQQADEDGNGLIDFNEFLHMMGIHQQNSEDSESSADENSNFVSPNRKFSIANAESMKRAVNKVVENVVRVVSHEEHVIESYHVSLKKQQQKSKEKLADRLRRRNLRKAADFQRRNSDAEVKAARQEQLKEKMYSMDSDSSENLKLDYQRSEATTGVSDTPSDGSSSRERRRTSVFLHAIETELEAFEARSNDLTSAPTIDEVGSLNEVEKDKSEDREYIEVYYDSSDADRFEEKNEINEDKNDNHDGHQDQDEDDSGGKGENESDSEDREGSEVALGLEKAEKPSAQVVTSSLFGSWLRKAPAEGDDSVVTRNVARKDDPNKASNVEEKVDTLADSKQKMAELLELSDSCRIFMEEMTIEPSTHVEIILAMPQDHIKTMDIEEIPMDEARRRFEEFSAEHNVRTGRLQVLGEEINDLWDDLGVQEEQRAEFLTKYSKNPLSEAALDGVSRYKEDLLRRKIKLSLEDLSARCGKLLSMSTSDEIGNANTSDEVDKEYSKAVSLYWEEEHCAQLKEYMSLEPENLSSEEIRAIEMNVETLEETRNGISLILQTIARREKLVRMRQELMEWNNNPDRLKRKQSFKELHAAERKEKIIKTDLPSINDALRKRLTEYADHFGRPFVLKKTAGEDSNGVPYLELLENSEMAYEAERNRKVKVRQKLKAATSSNQTKRVATEGPAIAKINQQPTRSSLQTSTAALRTANTAVSALPASRIPRKAPQTTSRHINKPGMPVGRSVSYPVPRGPPPPGRKAANTEHPPLHALPSGPPPPRPPPTRQARKV